MSLKTHLVSISAGEPAAIALRLTAVELLLRPMGPAFVLAPLLVVATLAILSTTLLFSTVIWYAAAALVAARIVADWPLPDNHIYLLGYWCLAVGLALGSRTPTLTLARSSRLLLGLAFGFAVLWKGVLSPDYRDGRFFTVTLITDPRFSDLTRLIGRLSADELAGNRRVLEPLPEGAELLNPPQLTTTRSFNALVMVATWGTLLLEGLLAAAFLAPGDGRLERLRHGLLLSFCLVTYAFAPVAGFGWLLLAMGCSLCKPDQHLLRIAYVAAWFSVLFYSEIPWTSPLVRWMS